MDNPETLATLGTQDTISQNYPMALPGGGGFMPLRKENGAPSGVGFESY